MSDYFEFGCIIIAIVPVMLLVGGRARALSDLKLQGDAARAIVAPRYAERFALALQVQASLAGALVVVLAILGIESGDYAVFTVLVAGLEFLLSRPVARLAVEKEFGVPANSVNDGGVVVPTRLRPRRMLIRILVAVALAAALILATDLAARGGLIVASESRTGLLAVAGVIAGTFWANRR